MRKLLSQYSRGTPLEGTNNLVWRFLGRCFHKQVNVIWFDSQIQDRPTVFLNDRFANFMQALRHVTNQHLFATLRYPNQMVIHLIHRMITASDFISFHVDSISGIDKEGKNKRALSS